MPYIPTKEDILNDKEIERYKKSNIEMSRLILLRRLEEERRLLVEDSVQKLKIK